MDKQVEPPVVFSLPDTTLQKLRGRRAKRRPAPFRADRPVVSSVELLKRAGEIDSTEAAAIFCEDMDYLRVTVEDEYDAFLLDPGMGPMMYITSSGLLIRDNRTWDGEGIAFVTSLDEAVSTLVVGAKKTGINELVDLIPRLENGIECSVCGGSRWWTIQMSEIVCPQCFGRGECPPTSQLGVASDAEPGAAADRGA